MLKALSSWIFQIPRGGTFTQQNRLLRDVVAVMLFVCFCHLNPVSISVLVYAFHQLLWSGLERFFLKGQKERTWRQLCCMSVGTRRPARVLPQFSTLQMISTRNSFLCCGQRDLLNSGKCSALHREIFNTHRRSWSWHTLSIACCCSSFSPWAESSLSCSSVLLRRRREASCSLSSSCCCNSLLVFSRFSQSLQRQVKRMRRPAQPLIPFS